MKKLRLILIALLLAACGDPGADDMFNDDEDSEELGSVEQGLATKFSSTYSHGLTDGSSRSKCTIALGAGSGQACILPGRGTVRFKLTGSDPHDGDGGAASMSWKYMARRAFTSDIKGAAINNGYGWPFGTAVEEDTANTWVEVTNGTCPGSVTSNNVYDFGCATWVGATTVTENLTGTYKKCGAGCTVKLTIDVAKIDERVRWQPYSGFDQDFHEALEHVVNNLTPAVYGSGTYMGDVFFPQSQLRTWSSRYMRNSNTGYDVSTYSAGEGCRMGNWSSQGPDSFSALTGSCPNNW